MDTNLSNEISTRPELAGASQQIIINKLNSENGSVETWVVDDKERLVPKGDMLAKLSLASQVKLYDWMKGEAVDEAKAFTLFYNAHEHFKAQDPLFRGTIQQLCSVFNLITTDEMNAVLKMGERLQTRAEELVGHKLTESDFI